MMTGKGYFVGRYKLVRISLEVLTDMIRQGWEVQGFRCIQGVPPDATLVLFRLDTSRCDAGELRLLFEHPSWEMLTGEDIKAGEWPELPVVFQKEAES